MPCFTTKYSWGLRASCLGALLILVLFSASATYAQEEKTEPMPQEKLQSPSTVNDIWDWIKSSKLPDGAMYLGTTSNYGKENYQWKADNSWLWVKSPTLPEGPLTLEESVALAMRFNRTIKSAYLNRVTQKYSLAVSEDEFVPDLTITPSYTLSSSGPSSSQEFRVNTNTYGANFSVSQKVKTGGTFTFAWANSVAESDTAENPTLTTSWTLGFSQPLLKGAGVDINTVSLRTARISEENNLLSLQSTLISTITSTITTYLFNVSPKWTKRVKKLRGTFC